MITTTLEQMNAAIEAKQGKGFRRHLGASIIGRKCVRQIWYIFRWAKAAQFKGRMLRLFARGHEEEIRLVNYMRKAGIHVMDVDPATGLQWRMSDHDGHLGGSYDSKLFDTPEFPMIEILGEYKTHNNNSYNQLKKKGLKESKYEHYVQTQVYMHYGDLPAALYFAVNKDNDDINVLTVPYDEKDALRYVERGAKVIYTPTPPPRPENAGMGWFICKWCDYKEICHLSAPKAMNCRTCIYSGPIEDAEWFCSKHNCVISYRDQLAGCVQHTPIPED